MATPDRFGTRTTGWRAFPEQGCWYRLEEGFLLYAPMNLGGSIDLDEDGDGAEVDFWAIDEAEANLARAAGHELEGDG